MHSHPSQTVAAPPTGALAVETCDAIAPIASEWEALADRVGAGPFARPGWIEAWLEAFGAGVLELVAVRRDGRLAGLVPLVVRRGVVRAPANSHTPQFELLAEDRETAERLATTVLTYRRARRLDLAFLPAGSLGCEALRAAAASAGRPAICRIAQRSPFVAITGTHEAFEAALNRRFVRSLDRRSRRLREHGDVAFVCHHGDHDLDALLDEAWQIEASSWKGAAGTAIASRPETRRFYEQVARWAADRGWLCLMELEVDGVPVAFELGLETAGSFFALKAGSQPQFARYGVGNLLCRHTISRAFEQGLRAYEFLGADEPYKLAWTSQVRPLMRVQVFSCSPAGRASHLAWSRGRPLVKHAQAARRRAS